MSPHAAPLASRGVLASVTSAFAFGLLFYLTPLLAPLTGEQLFALRMLITLPFVTVVLLMMRSWGLVAEIGRRVKKRPTLLLGVIACGLLLAAQIWLFSWAPQNGRALQVSLGYFLLPLVLVFAGRYIFQDRMVWWQWLAAGIAAVGIVYEIIRVGGVGWETLLVAVGYPVYFVLRRSLGTGHLGGMWWELLTLTPIAAVIVALTLLDGSAFVENPALWWSWPSISALAGVALLLYLLASRLLSMTLFGLLGYIEPALLVVASLLIGERIAGDEWFTYGAIWAAVLVLAVGGAVTVKRGRP